MKDYLSKCKIEFLNIKGADIPDAEYFKLKGTSFSRLKLLDSECGGSPQKYKEGFKSTGYNEALLLGTCVHAYVLQPEDFMISDYENKPSGKLGYFIECIYKFRKEGFSIFDSIQKASQISDYYTKIFINGSKSSFTKRFTTAFKEGWDYYKKLSSGYFNSDKEIFVLHKKLLEKYKMCVKAIENNRNIKKLLSPNIFEEKQFLNEIALFSDIKVTLPDKSEHIINFRGKLDSVIIDPESKTIYLNDIKTTSKGVDYFMDKTYIDDYGYKQLYLGTFTLSDYHVQMGIYAYLLQKYCEEVLHLTGYKYYCNMWVVETTNQHKCECFKINNSYISKAGFNKFKKLIVELAYYELNGFDKTFKNGNL